MLDKLCLSTKNGLLSSQRERIINEAKSGFSHKRNKERCRLALSQRLCPPVSPSAIRGYKALVCSSSAVFQVLRLDTASKTSLLQNPVKNTLTQLFMTFENGDLHNYTLVPQTLSEGS